MNVACIPEVSGCGILPAHTPFSEEGCVIYVKTGHRLNAAEPNGIHDAVSAHPNAIERSVHTLRVES